VNDWGLRRAAGAADLDMGVLIGCISRYKFLIDAVRVAETALRSLRGLLRVRDNQNGGLGLARYSNYRTPGVKPERAAQSRRG
jgi:hypothetical protein